MKYPLWLAGAVLAGALNVFAFAPFGLWPLQILCAAILFAMVLRAPDVRQAATLGWLYSFGWTCAGVHWLYISLHDYGGMPGWLTALSIALLALGLGLVVGAATALAHWLQRRWRSNDTITLLLILPALWLFSEWTRGWIFTGFPWLSTGYAHTSAALAGFAPLIGVYGVGWVAALMAGALVLLSARTTPRLRGAALLLLVLLPAAGQLLRGIEWTVPQGQPIKVRLLQGNIPQDLKFNQEILASTLGMYEAMITEAAADLIVTPETAVPVTRQQLPPDYLPRLADFATRSGSRLLVGIPISERPDNYTNSVVMFEPQGPGVAAVPYQYDKHHLVPFGEFIPSGFRWFVDLLQIPLGDLSRGALLQVPFAVRDQWVLPNICYEDLFGEEIAAQIRARLQTGAPAPTMLLNISNIAWFGNSIAIPQHLQVSQMRTLETGRPMLRATNTGATAVIGPHGQVLAALAPFSRGALATTVQGMQGTTPFLLFGNEIIVTLALLMLAVAGWASRRR